jgi:hypothetical protein
MIRNSCCCALLRKLIYLAVQCLPREVTTIESNAMALTGHLFCVKAVFSTSVEWKVTTAETRENTLPQESDNFEDVAIEADGLEVEENDDDVDGVIGDADGCANEVMSVTPSNRVHSPMKSRWLFPLIKQVIAKMPNLSNREMKNLLANYVKAEFLTTSLLQNARTYARTEVFGDPAIDVFFQMV